MPTHEHANAIDSVFFTYENYVASPTEETLFYLLTALDSLDEQLGETLNFKPVFDFPEYLALKTLRVHVSHVGYVRNVMRLRALPGRRVATDLRQACLVSRGDCHAALMKVGAARRAQTKRAFFTSFKQWGPVVDINPSVFNTMVKVYELLARLGLRGDSPCFARFAESYAHETEHEISHFVTGIVAQQEADEQQVQRLMTSLYDAA